MAITESSTCEQRPLPEGELLRLNEWEEPGAWMLAGFFVLVGIIVVDWKVPPGVEDIVIAVVAFGAAAMIAGVARSGLVVDREGVTVRSLWRSRRWAWSEVDRVEVKVPLFRGALRVHLVDGRVLSAAGLDGRTRSERQLSKAWLDEMNRRAAAARAASS
jgi:hypothetical protein